MGDWAERIREELNRQEQERQVQIQVQIEEKRQAILETERKAARIEQVLGLLLDRLRIGQMLHEIKEDLWKKGKIETLKGEYEVKEVGMDGRSHSKKAGTVVFKGMSLTYDHYYKFPQVSYERVSEKGELVTEKRVDYMENGSRQLSLSVEIYFTEEQAEQIDYLHRRPSGWESRTGRRAPPLGFSLRVLSSSSLFSPGVFPYLELDVEKLDERAVKSFLERELLADCVERERTRKLPIPLEADIQQEVQGALLEYSNRERYPERRKRYKDKESRTPISY